jgi:hypothetical protein
LQPWLAIAFIFLTAFFFSLDGKETKGQGCIFYATTFFRFAKEKELAALKQLFLFNATLHLSALRYEYEAGPLSLGFVLAAGVSLLLSYLFNHHYPNL